MPILFVDTNTKFIAKIKEHGYTTYNMKIEEYVPNPDRKTYYVSPANSLCFMDGGIDFPLSRIIMKGVEPILKDKMRSLGIVNRIDRPYLPIGSSIIVDFPDKSLIAAPTMLLPQKVQTTHNAYYATMAILYNILVNRGERLEDVDILMCGLCCGVGQMDVDMSIKQILDGIRDYKSYQPQVINKDIIVCEPNLDEQPKYYENTEWINYTHAQVIRH